MKNKGIGIVAFILIVFGAVYLLLNNLKDLGLDVFDFDDESDEEE